MNESPEDLAAVEQLLAESDALRGWLRRLDDAPTAAPGAVRDRVRADYQRRLDEVTARLQSHGDILAAKLSDDHAEHDALSARSAAAREALAEAELRHAVGEYDADRFSEEQTHHASDIEAYELALGAVAERIDRLQQIYTTVAMGVTPPSPRVAAPSPLPVEELPDLPVEEVPQETMFDAEPVAIADLAPDVIRERDDESLLAVFDEQVIAVEVEEPGSSSTNAPPIPVEIGPLSFRPTGAHTEAGRTGAAPPARPRPFDSAPPLGMPNADVPPRFVRPGERMAAPAVPPVVPTPLPPLPIPTPDPITPTAAQVHEAAAAVQVGRTLRCGECGAMNRPLEWYCEKCGAELMAM